VTYPKKTLAAVLTAYQQPVEVQELDVPALEAGAALVAVEASTMCGTDVHIAKGQLSAFSRLPAVLGHEIVGRVVALGKERTRDALDVPLAEGDRVVWSYAWCGHCFWCTTARQPTLCANARMYGWGPTTTFPHLTGGWTEYSYVMPQCKMLKVPEDIETPVVASATCAFRSVMHGYERIGPIEPMETVVIQGSGPVGLYALAYAVQAGARQVLCIGAPQERLAVATGWGASRVFDVTTTDREERRDLIMDLTESRGADLVVECSGVGAALSEGFDLVRKGGRYLVIGQADPTPVSLRGTDFNLRQVTVAGNLSGDIPHYYRAVRFLADFGDRFRFADLIGRDYGLAEVNDAIAAMSQMREIKPVILPQK
jgi:D-arabinose 1-dehydrogenase-like Zn-dependent alcohol dehydrogenase